MLGIFGLLTLKNLECLRVFTRFPQTSAVFFGGTCVSRVPRFGFTAFTGGHDNGYTSALTSLENEGLLHKVVLLRGYKDVAIELKNLQLPELTIDGVFMTQKLPTNIFQRNRGHVHETSVSISTPGSPKKASTHHTASNSGDESRYLVPGVVSTSINTLAGL